MNIRRLFAVWSAKLIKTACQITGRQGVTLAGKIALSIYPPILKELASEVKKDIFVVCGTNGKTTVTSLIKQILERTGHKAGLIGTIHVEIDQMEVP
ncbi:Mur ligase family protein, partial [Blautia sp.]|uniref:Mur ligase family protein n=1 Tax=Blautia sp. TaxID=1955243 RepID=UPI003AB13775